MNTTLDKRLDSIEEFLERIESKMDNYMGFDTISEEEKKEILKIKKEMNEGKYHSYNEVFD